MVPKNPNDYSNSLGYYHFESVIGSLNGLKCMKVNGKLSFSERMEKRGETFFVYLVGHFIMVITAWHAYLILYFIPKTWCLRQKRHAIMLPTQRK